MQLHELTSTQLMAGIRHQDLCSRDLVTYFLNRIEQLNPSLNAFLSVTGDSAIEQAERIDARRSRGESIGMLQGLPIAVKDNICVRGELTTCGSQMLRNFRPPYDAHVVERIRSEDGIIVGKLNMDEFAMGSTSETSFAGPARNPWNLNCTAGGSSGGSAVAVAAGMVPLALGSDTGGSIRQPAGFCGVVGMKPTYGRVSRYGLVAYASSLDQIGPFARDVNGVALLLNVIGGRDVRDSTSLDMEFPELGGYSGEHADLKGVRVGVVEEHFGAGLDPEVAAAVQGTVRRFESLGAEIVPLHLPHSRYSIAAYYLIACCEASSNLARYDGVHYGHRADSFENLVDLYCQSRGEAFGAEVKRRIMLGTFALSAGYYDAYYLKALKVRRRIREDFDKAFAAVDVIVSPVAPTAAFRLGEMLSDPLAMYLSDIYTISANLAGIPGIAVPSGQTASGLPIASQLLAAPFEEKKLLRLAAAIEMPATFPAV
ncbi:MAG: Asp-tRNA(Asn)/Glu-tRNA(Gln) amidotransferase subunit GatA [Planctomyces sp.]|nr:Asp-tRNA(Asn)/Glu-tRNA(Gln) amidotransferase subunit GatA [Planctomyces sp.]